MTLHMTEDSGQRAEVLSRLYRVLGISPSEAAHSILSAIINHLSSVVTDSREAKRGDTFVAYPGEKTDGRQFIAPAIARGADAVIYEKHWVKPVAVPPDSNTTTSKDAVVSGQPWEAQRFIWNDAWPVPHLAVADLRQKAGWLADAAYGSPSENLWVIGITGTNGKTSTSHWIARALDEAKRKCALIGTLGNGFIEALQVSTNTTPDAIHVHGLLATFVNEDARSVAMEVSSHALSQGRVNGVHFDVAMLTNLSRDHLDYHGDMQSYAAAKRKLFEWQQLKYVVLNLDDEFGVELARELSLQQAVQGNSARVPAPVAQPDSVAEIIGYGLSEDSLKIAERLGLRMVRGNLLEMSGQGSRLAVQSSWGTAELNTMLVGRFNAANLLGALAVLLVSEVGLDDAVQSLNKSQPVAGRMQRLGGAQQPTVIVDYAHTPDALEKVLVTLTEVSAAAGGRVICVFGCGGDRDRGKRPMMGLIAEKFSGFCIVTSDNPRSENPRDIIAEIVTSMKANNHEIMVDRAAAIKAAIGLARQSDTVLIAGKGHEDYQEISGVKHPFSDVQIAQQALQLHHHAGVCA